MNTLPENTLKTRVPQEQVERVVKPAPSRYRNEIAKYIVHRSLDCRTLRQVRGGLHPWRP